MTLSAEGQEFFKESNKPYLRERDADVKELVKRITYWTERFEPEELTQLANLVTEARNDRDTDHAMLNMEKQNLRIIREEWAMPASRARDELIMICRVIEESLFQYFNGAIPDELDAVIRNYWSYNHPTYKKSSIY